MNAILQAFNLVKQSCKECLNRHYGKMKHLVFLSLVQLAFVSIANGQGVVNPYCPYKWEVWGGNCLDVSELTGKTNQARTHCQNIGGSLAIVENRKQHSYLQEKLSLGTMTTTPLGCTNGDNGLWGCAGKTEDEWYWYNVTHNMGFWNWAPDEPDNDPGVSSRLFLNPTSNWTDESRNETRDMMVACLTEKVTTEVKCPISWEPVDNKCIYLKPHFTGKPHEVRSYCEGQGGSMVTVDSFAQNTYLTERLQATNNDYLVLGCTDQNEEGYWRCDDRTNPYMVHWKQNLTETGYWDWGPGQPADDDPEADCAFLRPSENWRALSCALEYEMVLACEHAPTSVVCPEGFQPWEDQCLHFRVFSGTALTARQECQKIRGNLVIIDNEVQNQFLQFQMNTSISNMAIGCGDAAEEGTWICDNKDPKLVYWKSEFDFSGYWNWNVKSNEPDDTSNQDCMYLYRKTGKHRSESCETVFNDMLLACTTDAIYTGYPDIVMDIYEYGDQDDIYEQDPNPEANLAIGATVGLIVAVAVALAIFGWIGYAFTHPTSNSGALLRIGRNVSSKPRPVET